MTTDEKEKMFQEPLRKPCHLIIDRTDLSVHVEGQWSVYKTPSCKKNINLIAQWCILFQRF